MEREKRLSFYNVTLTCKDGQQIKGDAILLPGRERPYYQIREADSGNFIGFAAEDVKSVVLTNKLDEK
jgi:hypothetical protein